MKIVYKSSKHCHRFVRSLLSFISESERMKALK